MMKEAGILDRAEPRVILQAVMDEKAPAIMTYLSRGKWHVAKVILTELGASSLKVEIWRPSYNKGQDRGVVSPRKESHPINIQVEQPVGMSIKYEYGKVVFGTKVLGFEPSPDNGGGRIVLLFPDSIELVERRSFFRVNVPDSLSVKVVLWPRRSRGDGLPLPPMEYMQGRLVDISAGGGQIAIEREQQAQLRKGQFIGVRFTPMPYEKPLMFNAQIRSVLPTADEKNICYGLQIIGLEASCEGREVLLRLVGVVEQYYKMNCTDTTHQDHHEAAKADVSVLGLG